MRAMRSGPGMGTEAAKSEFPAHLKDTVTPGDSTVAAHLHAADDALEAVWTALVCGTLRLDQLRTMSPHAAAIYLAGFDAGIAAQDARVRQAKHDADRMALFAMNGPERGAEIQHRLDRALASCPPNIEPWSPEYVEHALRGVLVGGAA